MRKLIPKRMMFCFIMALIVCIMPLKAENEKVMYLTYDDGPSPYTNELLDLLNEHHMKATFFLLEAEMKMYPDIVKRIINEGHSIGVHGVSHKKNTFYGGVRNPVNEMNQANQTLETIIGDRTVLARMPYGSYPYLTKGQRKALLDEHYIIWDWNIDSRDWSFRCPERAVNYTIKMIKKSNKEPKVILFHDIKYVTQTMQSFLKWMDENGYTSHAITSDITPVRLGGE